MLACTVAVITGKSTPDGRPLLYKNRDTDSLQNAWRYFDDGKYPYLALVNARDPGTEEIWMGNNSAGFAIMNSNSYNLILKDTVNLKDRDGILMKLALMQCATVDEFEDFLKSLPKPLGVETNFGVIDAYGGAAFFEVDNFHYVKLDVNDPGIAPFGYLVHTNFSFTGNPEKGGGYIRFETAQELVYRGYAGRSLTPEYVLQQVSRSLYHSVTRADLRLKAPAEEEERLVQFEEYIPRYLTSSSTVIQGVRKGEAPEFTTIWTVLGFPLTSVVVPLWECMGKEIPSVVSSGKDVYAPLCDKALKLKNSRVFPLKRGNTGTRYMNLSAVWNNRQTGTLQRLKPLEDKIFEETMNRLDRWRAMKDPRPEILQFYQWIDQTITTEYYNLYHI